MPLEMITLRNLALELILEWEKPSAKRLKKNAIYRIKKVVFPHALKHFF